MRPFGWELSADPALSVTERLYVRLVGVPVQGLRVRARYVLPACTPEARRILDAGCGRGAFSLHLARTRPGALVVAADIDEDRLRRLAEAGRRLGLRNLAVLRTDLVRPGLKAGVFDLVLSVDAIEDAADDRAAARALASALAPEGRLVVHTPAHERFWFVRWGPNFDAPGHARVGYRGDELRRLLDGAGLRVESLAPTYGRLETLANNLSYLVTGARERRKALYGLVFPFLLLLTWLGSGARPRRGAAWLAVAARP